ncbi:MAG: TPM domain-containing protein [Deltaproteobacteria bacterium]|nr:TPM domain-containing protein [Deltaproteobacteria bacterium]
MKAFSQQEQQRIEDAVTQAEKNTSGEIVPLILAQADDYQGSRSRFCALCTLPTASMTVWWFPQLPFWALALILVGSYFISSFIINNSPSLLRRVISHNEINECVDEIAHSSFTRHGLHHTRDETGILIIICLFERRVQILADRGINDKVEQQQWDAVVQTITKGLHSDHACDALCDAISQCGELLTPHFPIKEDDENELPNIIHH